MSETTPPVVTTCVHGVLEGHLCRQCAEAAFVKAEWAGYAAPELKQPAEVGGPDEIDRLQARVRELEERNQALVDETWRLRERRCATADGTGPGEPVSRAHAELDALKARLAEAEGLLRQEHEAFNFHVESGGKTKPGYTREKWERARAFLAPKAGGET